MPAPSDLPRLLAEYSGEGNRFTFIVGEIRRFTFLLRPAPLLPAILFFGAVGLVVLARERGASLRNGLGFVRRYATLLMLGFATFVALALLPSAEWGHYLVYYAPVLAVFAALAYESGRPSLRVGIGVGCLVVGAICVEAVYLLLPHGDVEAWVLTGWAFTGLVYGAVAAVLLCVSWVSGRREWLAAALILGVVVRLGLMAADHDAYADVVDALRVRAAETGGMVLGPPELGWAFAQDDFHPIDHNWDESPPAGIGAVATREGFAKPGWRDSCTFSDVEPVPTSSFVSNRFRGRGKLWEVGAVVCEEP